MQDQDVLGHFITLLKAAGKVWNLSRNMLSRGRGTGNEMTHPLKASNSPLLHHGHRSSPERPVHVMRRKTSRNHPPWYHVLPEHWSRLDQAVTGALGEPGNHYCRFGCHCCWLCWCWCCQALTEREKRCKGPGSAAAVQGGPLKKSGLFPLEVRLFES